MARPARVPVAPGVRARELVPALARGAQDAARVPARERASVRVQGLVRARVPGALAQVQPDAAALARAEGVLALAAQVLVAQALEVRAWAAQVLVAWALAARALAAAA